MRPPALERGTEVRSRRAALKRRVAAGSLDLALLLRGDALEHDEGTALDMKLGELLRAVPNIGTTRAGEIAAAADASLDARLHTITLKRRLAIADAVTREGTTA